MDQFQVVFAPRAERDLKSITLASCCRVGLVRFVFPGHSASGGRFFQSQAPKSDLSAAWLAAGSKMALTGRIRAGMATHLISPVSALNCNWYWPVSRRYKMGLVERSDRSVPNIR